MKRLWIELSKPPGTKYERGDKISLGKSIKSLPGVERLKLAKELMEMQVGESYLASLEVQSKIKECESRILADIAKLSQYAEMLEEAETLKKSMNPKVEQAKEYECLAKELWDNVAKDQQKMMELQEILEKETL